MEDEPVILADFSQDPRPSKKSEPTKMKVAEAKIEQVFQPRPPREWGVDPKQADVYLWEFMKTGAIKKNELEVLFAGKYIGLVHFIPQQKDDPSLVLLLDAAHGMEKVEVFSGRWAEPQINAVIRKAERTERDMPQQIQNQFDEAAVSTLTLAQAKERITDTLQLLLAPLDPETHKISVGEVKSHKDEHRVTRIDMPITVVFPSGTVLRADCDAIHGLRNIEFAFANPLKLSINELVNLGY